MISVPNVEDIRIYYIWNNPLIYLILSELSLFVADRRTWIKYIEFVYFHKRRELLTLKFAISLY